MRDILTAGAITWVRCPKGSELGPDYWGEWCYIPRDRAYSFLGFVREDRIATALDWIARGFTPFAGTLAAAV